MPLKKLKLKAENYSTSFAQKNNNILNANGNEGFSKARWGDNSNLNPQVVEFLSTIEADYQFYPHIIDSLKAQFKMNVKRSIIPEHEGKQLIEALEKVQKELADKKIVTKNARSVYDLIENRISEIAPEAHLWFSVARSKSSQTAGDLRIWVRDAIDKLDSSLQELQSKLLDKSDDTVKTLFSANISSQLSQPSSFGHHLLAYVEMFGRDRLRLKDARNRMNESPFASGEIAGSSFNLNRDMVARILSFDNSSQNSVDAICSRDFVVEFISIIANGFINLSRLSNEMISWHSSNNNYINFDSSFVEQNSVLPYRRDQISLETIRAKSSKAIGALTSILSMIKDLPLEPSRDFAEMIDITVNTFKDFNSSISIMTIMVANFTLNRKAMKEAATKDFSTAQDLVDWLVQKTGVNIVEATSKTRQIIDYAIEKGKKLSLLELDEIKKIEPLADEDIYSVLIPSRALIARRSGNGSNPVQIRKAIRAMKRKIFIIQNYSSLTCKQPIEFY